jgi:hypothetical protein
MTIETASNKNINRETCCVCVMISSATMLCRHNERRRKSAYRTVMGNLRYQYRRERPAKTGEPSLPFGVQVSLHIVSLTLDMLPVVLTEDRRHSSLEWPLCSTYHGAGTESGRCSTVDCRRIENVQMCLPAACRGLC